MYKMAFKEGVHDQNKLGLNEAMCPLTWQILDLASATSDAHLLYYSWNYEMDVLLKKFVFGS